MQDGQLLISGLIEHAEIYHTDTEIVSRTVEGPIHRYTLKDAANRSRKLANALGKLGLQQGDVVGTLAWNTFRHFELYFGVSGIGCVVNTVNPRLFPEQLTYIINHAANKYLFVDLTFVPLVDSISDSLEGIKGIIVLTDKEHMPETELKNVICYEELIAEEPTEYDWPVLMKIQLLVFVIPLEQRVILKGYCILIDQLFCILGLLALVMLARYQVLP